MFNTTDPKENEFCNENQLFFREYNRLLFDLDRLELNAQNLIQTRVDSSVDLIPKLLGEMEEHVVRLEANRRILVELLDDAGLNSNWTKSLLEQTKEQIDYWRNQANTLKNQFWTVFFANPSL